MILRNEARFKYDTCSLSLPLRLFPVSPEELAITWWVLMMEDTFWLSICAPRRSPVLYTWRLGMSTAAAQHVEELSRWKWLPNSAVCWQNSMGHGFFLGFTKGISIEQGSVAQRGFSLVVHGWSAGVLCLTQGSCFIWAARCSDSFCSNNVDVVKLEAGCQVFSGLRHKPAYCCGFSSVFYSEQRISSKISCE